MTQLHRKSPAFWDDLNVPAHVQPAHLFTWLEENAPLPEEHDFVLSTDGSGCSLGWGASASIIQKVEEGGLLGRQLGDYQPIVTATYGSTVQRRELAGLLDGLHEILRLTMQSFDFPEDEDEPVPPLRHISGDSRITVMWYTDRANLAKSLLFDERGDVMNRRSSERDMWMRFSFLAKHFCITPMWTDRNLIPAQAVCDALCTVARKAMKDSEDALTGALINNYEPIQWKIPRPQKALF